MKEFTTEDFLKLLNGIDAMGGNVGTYADRKVDLFKDDDKNLFISTAKVSDGFKPFETAVGHPEYDGGKLIIVEAYDTKEKAQEGHNKWVKVMTSEVLPDFLVDCCNNVICKMLKEKGGNLTFKREKK